MTWALDLDGVVWLAGHTIPGSAEAISDLRSAGERVVFLTDNGGPLVAGHVEALAKVGVQCAPRGPRYFGSGGCVDAEPG